MTKQRYFVCVEYSGENKRTGRLGNSNGHVEIHQTETRRCRAFRVQTNFTHDEYRNKFRYFITRIDKNSQFFRHVCGLLVNTFVSFQLFSPVSIQHSDVIIYHRDQKQLHSVRSIPATFFSSCIRFALNVIFITPPFNQRPCMAFLYTREYSPQ